MIRMFFASIIFFHLLSYASTSDEEKWPNPDFTTCEFYEKAENILKCESHGSDYLRGYGLHYCNRFKEISKDWDGKLKKWVEDTGQCLQEMLFDNRKKRLDTCSNMEEFAFDVHPICYKQYGICNLSPTDYWKLKDMLRAIDILNLMKNPRRSKTQIDNVYDACIEKFGKRVEDTVFGLIFDQIGSMTNKIKKLSSDVFLKAPKLDSKREKYFDSALTILLYDKLDNDTNQAAALFHRQYVSRNEHTFEKMNENAIKCFNSLGSGSVSPLCDNSVANDYKQSKFEKNITRPKYSITEEKLQRILYSTYESK